MKLKIHLKFLKKITTKYINYPIPAQGWNVQVDILQKYTL